MPSHHRQLARRQSSLVQPSLVRRVAGLFGPYKAQVAIVGAIIVLTAGLGAVNPVLIKVVFDSALFPADGTPNLMLLWVLAAVMAAIAVASGVLSVVQTYMTSNAGQDVMGACRRPSTLICRGCP